MQVRRGVGEVVGGGKRAESWRRMELAMWVCSWRQIGVEPDSAEPRGDMTVASEDGCVGGGNRVKI